MTDRIAVTAHREPLTGCDNQSMRWSTAINQALYGPKGVFTDPEGGGPTSHFRTSSLTGPLFANAVADFVVLVDQALGHPDRFELVEVAAGRGELIEQLIPALPIQLRARLCPIVVELAPRPPSLPAEIAWTERLPERLSGLLLAVEWLDNVPLDLVTFEDGATRYLLVDPEGRERPGPAVDQPELAWLEHWWPVSESGLRAEIGLSRDLAWADAVSRVSRGMALAIDYGHFTGQRPPLGTLTGFRNGREVTPVPDGTCDLTAHVAMDSVATAGARIAGQPASLVTQRDALRSLGVTGARPPLGLASTDPLGYLRQLSTAGTAAELTDPSGLGGHLWLAQPVDLRLDLPWGTGIELTPDANINGAGPVQVARKPDERL